MRFQKYLDQNRCACYNNKYLDFENINERVKNGFTEEEERAFLDAFEKDLETVFSFIQFEYEDLEDKLIKIEELIKQNRGKRELYELQDKMSMFAEFIRLNIKGYKAILSRHDRKTGFEVVPKFKKIFKSKLNQLEGLNNLIYSASRLKLKTLDIRQEKEDGTSFVRKSTKYWVHYDNIYALKLQIIKNLPIYVFANNLEDGSPFSRWDYNSHDTCVSSVYLDNVDFELYMGRLYKNQGAEAIRIRWYGSKMTPTVFIERKRHENNWTGLSSKKLRFKIAEKYVLDYLNGNDVWEHVKMLNGSDSFDLYKEIQSAIITKNLRPSVRTFYRRNAFQLPNDSSVRLSLDTNLVMIRELPDDAFENPDAPVKHWRRTDVESNWPFKELQKNEIVRFPHAILEVKTQGRDETKPGWIEDLVLGSYVEHVHKYSKFMHGTSLLYKHLQYIPFWIPQMATDIRKDPFHPIKSMKKLENNQIVNVSGENDELSPNNVELVEDHGKKIAMPIRIEPKVFMANERTFLKWVQFAIFLGGVGTAILGLGDQVSALCGSMLMIVSIMFIFYAFYIFKWRNEKIRIRFPGPYDDLVGPTVLVFVFLTAMLLAIIFKYPYIMSAEEIV